MYNYKDEDTLLNLIQGLLREELSINIINVDVETPEGNLNYHIENQKSYYYTIHVYFKYHDSHQLESATLYLPKLENNLYYYNPNGVPKLKVMVNTFQLSSPFKFNKVKRNYVFSVPKLFTIYLNKNSIFYKNSYHDLSTLDNLNISLPERCWKKLNYYNKNIVSGKFTSHIFNNDILPTLYEYMNDFQMVTYYDLNIKSLKDKFLETLYNNNYIKHKLNLFFKKHKKLYLTPLQSTINEFFNVIDNADIQTIITTNPMSLESQVNKVYIESKNKHKLKIVYNKSFINFLCPVHTHEGQLTNIRNELSKLVDAETFKLKLLDNDDNKVLVDHYDYYNAYLYITDNIKLHRGEFIESAYYDYKKRHIDDGLSISSSCIPMINSTDSVRGILGTTMMSQAIPVIGSSPNMIYTDSELEIYDKCKLNIYSNYKGKITNITTYNVTIDDKHVINRPDSIKSNNNTYNNYYLNTKLKVGDEVDFDTPIYILDSFKHDQLSLAVQSRIGYMNYYGYTFEDGIVISESLSKSLGHIHREKLEYCLDEILSIDYISAVDDIKIKDDVILLYSVSTKNEKLKKIKELLNIPQTEIINIKLPSHIQQGRIINVSLKYKDKLDKSLKSIFVNNHKKDSSLTSNYVITLVIEYVNYAKLGDKLTNRYGSKGVITKIVNDDEMPHDSNNQRIDLIMSPDSIISRKNVSQVPEVILGNMLKQIYEMNLPKNHEVFNLLYGESDHDLQHDKAAKLGYYTLKLNAGNDVDYHKLINKISDLLSIDFEVSLYDPLSKRWFKNKILVGYTSLLRLHFIVEHKSKSTNDYMTDDPNLEYKNDVLLGGGYYKPDGQKIGEMELWTFLSYNNLELLKYLQGDKVRQHKANSLMLSMYLSGLNPVIKNNSNLK